MMQSGISSFRISIIRLLVGNVRLIKIDGLARDLLHPRIASRRTVAVVVDDGDFVPCIEKGDCSM